MTLRRRLFARAMFYPTLAWNYWMGRVLKRRKWWDYIDEFVIVGARPLGGDVGKLHELGVRAVVNTCEEYRGPTEAYRKNGIEQLHLPTTDFTPPRLEHIEEGVEFTQRNVVEGKTVYIHCKAGRARSATIALCWLVKYRAMEPEEAQLHLLKARPHINPRLTQRPVVQAFVEKLRQPPPPGPSKQQLT